MAISTAAAAAGSTPPPISVANAAVNRVDESLWWDSFVALAEELERAPLSSDDADAPNQLMEKLKKNHGWFLDSVSRFRPPNQTSRLVLDSSEVLIGSHRLVVTPQLKEAALRVSKCLCLDEVQSLILVHRSIEMAEAVVEIEDRELLYKILLQYYLERQCLLHCTSQIFVNAYNSDRFHSLEAFKSEVLQLVQQGLEYKLQALFKDLLLSIYCDKSEMEFIILWVEEVLIEANLVLDTLFLAYYGDHFQKQQKQWKSLCLLFKKTLRGSFNMEKVAVSSEAIASFCQVKAKLLLILVENLDLENLVQMVRDEVPIRQGSFVFSFEDIQEIDGEISTFLDSEAVEAGPLILTWAVFLCLIFSLPEANDSLLLMDIDHRSYIQQAFELKAFDYLVEILSIDTFRDTDGPLSGFLSVIRTLISAFIASYELSYQIGDNIFAGVLDIICKIYHGEESLCTEFWDKKSYVDGPIRSVLFTLENEYPFRITEFLQLLSALCEGKWPAECVYNYLDNMTGVTMLFKVPGGSDSLKVYDVIENHQHLQVPGFKGVLIPRGTKGCILKIIDKDNILVRWEFAHSGVLLLLLLLAEFHSDDNKDVPILLNLLHRLISFNKDICYRLLSTSNYLPIEVDGANGQMDSCMSVDAVQVICNLILSLSQVSSNARTVSSCFDILAGMLKCSPSYVSGVMLKSNVLATEINGASRTSWKLFGALTRMFMHEFVDVEDSLALATSVLSFIIQLIESGSDDRLICPLVIFCLQHIFLDCLQWKVKTEFYCWNVALKVFDVLKSCYKPAMVSLELRSVISSILLHDSSVYNTFCLILGTSAEALRSYASRNYTLKEVECLQLLVCSGFDVVHSILADFSQESFSSVPSFLRTMFSPSTKALSAVTSAVSLISFSENPDVQIAAARTLSSCCRLQLCIGESISSFLDAIQIKELRMAVYHILSKEVKGNEELMSAILHLLTSIAYFQPACLTSLMVPEEKVEISSKSASNMNMQHAISSFSKPSSSGNAILVEAVLKYLQEAEGLVNRSPHMLLGILNLLKATWEGGIQYANILERFRSSKKFWECLSLLVISTQPGDASSEKNLTDSGIQISSIKYLCQRKVLEIMAHELFLQEKQLHSERMVKGSLDVSKSQFGTKPAMPDQTHSPCAQDIILRLFSNHIMENLLKSYSESRSEREVMHHSKLAVSACIVHLMAKLGTGDAGSLSISLVNEILQISNKLTAHPAFAVLLSQYALRGYSEKQELTKLIVSDLYYHIQGELEGRKIVPGPFMELSSFLLDLEPFKCNEQKHDQDFWTSHNNFYIFHIACVHEKLGIELWDLMGWKTTKEIAERMFSYMHKANFAATLTESKYTAMKALLSVVSVYKGKTIRTIEAAQCGREIPESFIESGIKSLCSGLQKVADSLKPVKNIPEVLLRTFANHEAFLLFLSMISSSQSSQDSPNKKFFPLYLLIIRTSDSAIKVFAGVRPLTPGGGEAVKLLLKLLLISFDFCYHKVHVNNLDMEVKLLSEVSLISVRLLPVLCKFSEDTEYSNLSVAIMDVILKGFLAPETWLPILRNHLSLQLILDKLHKKYASVSVLVILNFLLTLGHTKHGAEMLYHAKIFNFLKLLFNQPPNGHQFSSVLVGNDLTSVTKDDEYLHLWVVSLAIITSVISSLGDDPSYNDLIASVIRYFFSEKAYLMPFFLSALNFGVDSNSKKRARIQNSHTSLTRLKLTECTLALLCALARHQASWSRVMSEMNSELREHIIHLLAFISKGSSTMDALYRPFSLFFHPTLKEEIDLLQRPSFVSSKHGWFAVRIVGSPASTVASSSDTSLSVLKVKGNEIAASGDQSCLSDLVAIHIYRVTFLLLVFLNIEAKAAVKRAEEVEYIDLLHFPELPTPEILHGLQDQVVAIVLELLGSNGTNALKLETESICRLLLQLLEKSLYLELCVYQSCGIRPVLGRLEDFSKTIKVLIQVAEQHSKFKMEVRSLKQIITLVYPGLLQTKNITGM